MQPNSKPPSYAHIWECRLNLEAIHKHKDGHYVLVKRTIHLEDITVVNIYVFNVGATSFINQTLKA